MRLHPYRRELGNAEACAVFDERQQVTKVASLPLGPVRPLRTLCDVPRIGQVSRARGKARVPRRPFSLVMTLRLVSAMIHVLRICILLGQRADGAIALSACRGEGMAALVTLRNGACRAAGTCLGLDALAVSKREGGPRFRILHDCTVRAARATGAPQ
jgi:hypothetical protein